MDEPHVLRDKWMFFSRMFFGDGVIGEMDEVIGEVCGLVVFCGEAQIGLVVYP